MASKLEEGLEYVKQAEKCLKTNFLRWKPDYDIAADKYQQAALCFRLAREFGKSKDCLLRAADCHQQNLALFHAAKCLDQVTLLSKDLNDYTHVFDLGQRASYLFLQYGSPEAAVGSLEKAGKILESHKPENSVKLYQKAADILKNEENNKQATEYLSRSSKLLVRLGLFDQAVVSITSEIDLHVKDENYGPVGRLLVGLILVYLTMEDGVAAEKAYRQWGSYCQPPERENLETLIYAYDEEDFETVKRCLNHPFIMHMDVEFAKLARNLRLPNLETEGKDGNAENLKSALKDYENKLEELRKEAHMRGETGEEGGETKEGEVDEEEEGLC